MSYRILIDMDGVVAEFVGGLMKFYRKEFPYKEGSKGSWDCFKLFDESEEEFWKEHATKEFWANLDKTPECDEVVRLAIETVGEKNVAFCTSPPSSPWARSESIIGKSQWIEKCFPKMKKNVIFTSVKHFCATDTTLLIDDATHNYEDFIHAGGQCCLFPRPWNENFDKDPLTYLRDQILDFRNEKEIYEKINNMFGYIP